MTVLKYSSSELIESVRNYARLPDNDSAGSNDADILRGLNEHLQTKFLPDILRVREEFNVFSERIPLVANQSRYPVSRRAVARKLRHVFYISGTGTRSPLAKIQPEQRARYSSNPTSVPQAFYFEWNHLVLVPDLSTAEGQLEASYFFRPSEIVPIAETAVISNNPNLTTGLIALQTFPAGFPGAVPGVLYDIHSPDSGQEIRVFDLLPNASQNSPPSTFNLVFDVADINGSKYGKYVPKLGDFVCLAGECAVPFLPREMHPLLAKSVAVLFLRAQGHHESADRLEQEVLQERGQMIEAVLEDRDEGAPQTFVNRHSFLRRSRPYALRGKDEF